jgi:hypothetical protein
MFASGTRPVLLRPLLAVAALLLVAPASVQAAEPAGVTVSACRSDAIGVAGKVSLSGSSARKARGALLQVRFQAFALFGLPHSGQWRSVGKKTKATAAEDFTGLAADNWVGVMNWRFKKGSRTVLSGLARSQPLHIGSSKGRASCTIAEGLKPPDVTAPALFIVPGDDLWHHAAATVQLTASDNFSGVKSMRYAVDGGAKAPISNGGTFTLAGEGGHTVDWDATDVAGNTASRSAVVKVDAAPPTKPAFSRPSSVTASTTPTFQWSASTDTGSGMRGYALTLRRASDNAVVAFQTVGADTTSLVSPATLTDGETYTAVVTAVDNTADKAWTTDSDTLTFRVDKNPDVSSPQDGQVLAFEAKKAAVVVNFDRPIDQSTKSGVTLSRDSAAGTSTGASAATCSSPCSSVSFTPTSSSGFPEGRYTISVNVKSDEGVAMQKTIHFAVPDPANEDPSASTAANCTPLPSQDPYSVRTTAGGETILASFDYSIPSGTIGRVRVLEGPTQLASRTLDAGNSGVRQTVPFTITTAGTHALTFEYCDQSGSGTLALSNIWVSRAP